MNEIHQFISKQPCYEQHVIEIKKIYESRLFTILVPNIYEGFNSLYNIAKKFEKKFEETMKNNPNVEPMTILIIFQKLLSNIPNLTTHKIRGETDRIKTASRSADIFDELVKAVIKSNIILMTYNVDYKRKDLIQTRYHDSVIVHDFVHSCYIESARVFHSRPELFWTGYDPIMINQNKRIAYEVIENAIRESINVALPMKEILAEYLNNPYEMKEDIRIYVIGEPKENTKLDLKNNNLYKYPGEFRGNGDLIKRGGQIREEDEEFINARDMIDRDLGIYIGDDNHVNSLLETDEHNNNAFQPHGNSNLSILLGSDSEAIQSLRATQDNLHDSLLDESEIPHITPVEGVKEHREDEENINSNNDISKHSNNSNDSKGSVDSNAVVDGVRMVNLKASMNGRGQAKNFFDEILPDANKKAIEYRKKMKEKHISDDIYENIKSNNKTDIHVVDTKIVSNIDRNKKDSDEGGIKITRTTENESRRNESISSKDLEEEDIITDNVEDLLANILSGNKK